MGDNRRFDLCGKLIEKHIPKDYKIADIASGNGQLQARLWQAGYKNITSWDKRHRNGKNRKGYRYGYFSWQEKERYDAVIGMHPDETTDHIIKYAVKNKVLAILCPCCIKPSAELFWEAYKSWLWIGHLKRIAWDGGLEVIETILRMNGKSLVLICKPKRRIP